MSQDRSVDPENVVMIDGNEVDTLELTEAEAPPEGKDADIIAAAKEAYAENPDARLAYLVPESELEYLRGERPPERTVEPERAPWVDSPQAE